MKVEPAPDLFNGPNPRVAVNAKALLDLLATGSDFRRKYEGKFHSLFFDIPWGEIMKIFSTFKLVDHDEPIPSCDIVPIVQALTQLVKLDERGFLCVRVPPGMSKVAIEWTAAFRSQQLKVNCLTVQIADSWCNTKAVINSARPKLTRTGHMWLIAHKGSFGVESRTNFSKYLINIFFLFLD